MKNALLLSIVLIFTTLSLRGQKLPEDDKTGKIFFGSRTETESKPTEYVLFDKGRLFKVQNDSLIRIRRVSREQVILIDSLIRSIGFCEIKLNDPGNVSYFIRIAREDCKNEVVWSHPVDYEAVSGLYNLLTSTLKK